MKKISVFGSTGFIGSRFCEMYPEMIIPIEREKGCPSSKDVLYLISTVDNYGGWYANIYANMTCLLRRLEYLEKDSVFNFCSSWFIYGDVELPAN